MALPWDALFLASFAYSGYRTLGRWLKYTDDTAKAQSDGAYIEGFREYLAQAAADGERDKPNPGAGADASGQGHLWREWPGMKTKQRIALLEEMRQVLDWTGQESAFRALAKHHGTPWAQLPHSAKKALLAAADSLDWSFLDDFVQEGAAIANSSCLWQVNEALPLLSAEPALAEALLEDAQALQELVGSADIAINALISSQQEEAIAALAPAQQLQVSDAKKKVDLLREAAQGGLGLGSGGKAARGQQLLELLRSFSLTPAEPSVQQEKADAAAALDAAADEAVSSLKAQQQSALAAAIATARAQAVTAALYARIRFSPGKSPLSFATAGAVLNVAAEEAAAALATVTNDESGLAARRTAAESLKEMAGTIDSTTAALAAVQEDAAEAGGGAAAAGEEAVRQMNEASERLQDAVVKVVQLKLKAEPAAAKPAAASAAAEADTGEESENGAAAAEDGVAAAVAAVEEALQAIRAAVEALPAQPAAVAAAEGEQDDGAEAAAVPTLAGVAAELAAEIEDRMKAVEEKTSAQQQTALQAARSRERMSVLLAKAKQLMTPAAAAPAAAAAADGEPAAAATTPAPAAAMQPGEKLAVAEEYLRQLGTRPLAAALMDLDKLCSAQAAAAAVRPDSQAGSGSSSPEGLAAGQALEAASQAALTRLGELLSEIELADSVMKLELGSSVINTSEKLSGYLGRLQERHRAAQEESKDESADESAAESASEQASAGAGIGVMNPASTPTSIGVSPNLVKEMEAIERCEVLIQELKGDGLVVLGLSAAQYRQLGNLREAAGSLSCDLDALKYDRCVAALKDVAAQLGPIGAAIQVKLAGCDDEATRALMSGQKSLAVDLYSRLQKFLTFEEEHRGPLKKVLRELNSLAGGIGAPRTPQACAAATLKVEMAADEAQKLHDLLTSMRPAGAESADDAAPPAPDSLEATLNVVMTLQGSVEALQSSLGNLAAHVALRVRALNPEVAAAAAAAGLESSDLPEINTLEQMEPELDHPLTLLSECPQEQQQDWETIGLDHIARGRVATVLIATATVDFHPADESSAKSAAGTARGNGVPRVSVGIEGLPSGKSVLQLAAERILRLQQWAAEATFGAHSPVTRYVQWYIMTCPATHDQLQQLLKEHSFFGLSPSQVQLFKCSTAPPAFAGEPLRVLTLGAATLTRGQPGSGEVFATLKSSGALGHMRRTGIRHVEINAADDNVLWRPADPLLVGFAASEGIDAAAKVVEPESVAAAYGAAMRDGADAENDDDAAGDVSQAKLLDESIGFLAPAIGSYYFSFNALSSAANFYSSNPLAMYRLVPVASLPSKAAAPSMSVNLPPNATQAQRMQAHQALVAAQQAAANAPPKQVEGYVPTRVLSDIFATGGGPSSPSGLTAGMQGDAGSPLLGCRLAYLGVSKGEEFSPMFGGGPHFVVPEPDLAAADLMGLTTMWVENTGAVVECEEGVEVSPLVSYAGEALEALAGEGVVFSEPYDLGLQGATSTGKPKHNAGRLALPVAVAYAVGAGLAVLRQVTAAQK